MQVLHIPRAQAVSSPLEWNMTCLHQLSFACLFFGPGICKISGHVDIKHLGLFGTERQSVGCALELRHNGQIIPGSTTGMDMTNAYSDPYAPLIVSGMASWTEPGIQLIEVWARAYSSAAPNKNGLAEVRGGYNFVLYEPVW